MVAENPAGGGRLAGRVAIVTGAGRGLGRAHALALAAEGAAVVVNDLGGDLHGAGSDPTPAQEVAAEIEATGGRAIVSGHDVADWGQAAALIALAAERFGDLHVLVNNAGILRDRLFANMSEDDWDAVIRVHLKGHAATTRHAMAWWRERSKAGHAVRASVVHTTSLAGLVGSFGRAMNAAAKLAVVGLSRVVALEGAKYGVRSNAVSPSARTRIETSLKAPPPGVFDVFDPANVSPLIAWLAEADCPASGQVFQAYGDRIEVIGHSSVAFLDVRTTGRWTPAAIETALAGRLPPQPTLGDFVEGLAPPQRWKGGRLRIDPSKVGFERDSEEFRVNSHRLAQFAAALGEAGDGRVASPVFAHIPVMQSMVEAIAAATDAKPLHGEHDFHFHRPIVPGLRLFSRSRLQAIRPSRAGVLLVVRSDSETHEGEPVATQYSTCLIPGETLSGGAGEPAPPVPTASGAAPLGERSLTLPDDQGARYAEAARDYSPYTLDGEAARAKGFPAPILHGMCTLGLAARALLELGCGGDPTRLRRLGCRFTHPLFLTPGQRLTTRVSGGGRQLFFTALDAQGNEVVRNGFAEVAA